MSFTSRQRLLGRLLVAIGAGSVGTASCGEQEPESCGSPVTRFCLNDSAMEYMSRYGGGQVPLETPRSDQQIATAFDAQGCLRHDWVTSSCCNPALGRGQREGDTCCYSACDGVCCGRALRIAGRALLSQPGPRADWLGGAELADVSSAPLAAPTPAERACLVELWTADALMEHASIASFARFALQLLALGAPAHMIRDAHSAGLDEIRHAEHTFAIASRLAGRALGPSQLRELGAPLETELGAVARATLIDGCIGETLAAVVAREQALRAGDPSIRQALLDVAEDETRHAELAFRFVAWALGQGGPALREELRREVERRLEQPPAPSPTGDVPSAVLHHYGRLSAEELRALYRQTQEEILRPLFRALLEGGAARAEAIELHA